MDYTFFSFVATTLEHTSNLTIKFNSCRDLDREEQLNNERIIPLITLYLMSDTTDILTADGLLLWSVCKYRPMNLTKIRASVYAFNAL